MLLAGCLLSTLAAGCNPANTGDHPPPAVSHAAGRQPCAPAGGADSRGVWIPPQTATIGSLDFEPEEAPPLTVSVAGFWIDATEVTNAQFAQFVAATGYVTRAERTGRDGAPEGGAVFAGGWRLDPTATWRKPFGAAGPDPIPEAPVVQIAYADALAYAAWRGRDLPGEAEWEVAARGGLREADYVWGETALSPAGKPAANHWQGLFPVADTAEDGYRAPAPVGCFAPNGYGLYDMAGNVWEWTKDRWSMRAQAGVDSTARASSDPALASGVTDGRVIKGGSWLCADNFCRRYRPAARQPGDPSLGTNHIGFRTVLRGAPPAQTPAQRRP
jgi:formylglycine-generating enzyme required for sulfatase activity